MVLCRIEGCRQPAIRRDDEDICSGHKAAASRRVVRYAPCPECACWSLGVQANGNLVRHSVGIGWVERLPKGSILIATPVCKGSGRWVGHPSAPEAKRFEGGPCPDQCRHTFHNQVGVNDGK